jgi:hypothetical protein
LASNFISLRSLRDSSQADIALVTHTHRRDHRIICIAAPNLDFRNVIF